jgi:hypothetical protein
MRLLASLRSALDWMHFYEVGDLTNVAVPVIVTQ